jgi:hypothetical protein
MDNPNELERLRNYKPSLDDLKMRSPKFAWAQEQPRTPIIVITAWEEVARVGAKISLNSFSRILIFLRLRKKPVKTYWIGANIEIKEPHHLLPNDSIIFYNRHECVWYYLGIVNGKHRITSSIDLADIQPYTGPAVIIGNSWSEFTKNPYTPKEAFK